MSPAIYFPTGTFINQPTSYVIYDLKRLSGLHVGKTGGPWRQVHGGTETRGQPVYSLQFLQRWERLICAEQWGNCSSIRQRDFFFFFLNRAFEEKVVNFSQTVHRFRMALSHVALPFILFDVSFNFMQAADAQDTGASLHGHQWNSKLCSTRQWIFDVERKHLSAICKQLASQRRCGGQ